MDVALCLDFGTVLRFFREGSYTEVPLWCLLMWTWMHSPELSWRDVVGIW